MTSDRLRRLLPSLSLLVVLAVGAPMAVTAVPVGAAPAVEVVAQGSSVDPNPGIIPAPNSGQAPQDAGDRGGWTQSVLFFLLCGAILLIFLLAWRDSRVKRRRAGASPGQPVRTRP